MEIKIIRKPILTKYGTRKGPQNHWLLDEVTEINPRFKGKLTYLESYKAPKPPYKKNKKKGKR